MVLCLFSPDRIIHRLRLDWWWSARHAKGCPAPRPHDGTIETIAQNTDERLVWQSMFWTPDGSKLLLSAVNGPQRWLEWQFWDEEGQHIINQFLPTREQIFFLHFFEQFVHSHPIVSTGFNPLLLFWLRGTESAT